MRTREHGAAGMQQHSSSSMACWLARQREEKRLPGWPTTHLLAAAQVPFAALLHAAGQRTGAAHNLRHTVSVSLLAARQHFVQAGLPGKERHDCCHAHISHVALQHYTFYHHAQRQPSLNATEHCSKAL